MKLLLEKGANIKATDNSGKTVLRWAARGGHAVVVGLLLKKGAMMAAVKGAPRFFSGTSTLAHPCRACVSLGLLSSLK